LAFAATLWQGLDNLRQAVAASVWGSAPVLKSTTMPKLWQFFGSGMKRKNKKKMGFVKIFHL
jgi:hypothetical protein